MKLSQWSLSIIGILCTVIGLGCETDADKGVNNMTIGRPLLPSTKIAFTSHRKDNADIYVMNADRTDVVNITNHEAHDSFPAWSPDGKKIAFVSTRDGHALDVCVMKADGTNVVNLTKFWSAEYDPVWSPDGKKIAFVSDRHGNSEIYVMNADGTDVVNITKHEAHNYDPAWSPDGTTIAFTSHREGNPDIYDDEHRWHRCCQHY